MYSLSEFHCVSYVCFIKYSPFGFLEGVKVIAEALVKSVTCKDDKLEIQLKDGRLVGSSVFAQVRCNSQNDLLVTDYVVLHLVGENRSHCCSCWPGAQC